jgi:hypothetical protein
MVYGLTNKGTDPTPETISVPGNRRYCTSVTVFQFNKLETTVSIASYCTMNRAEQQSQRTRAGSPLTADLEPKPYLLHDVS